MAADQVKSSPHNKVTEEWQKVCREVTYFCQKYAYYRETRGKNKGIRKFEAWDWQLALLWRWQFGFDNKNWHVVLKSRQLGVTWMAVIFLTWMAITQAGTNALILSYREDAAKMVIRRIRDVLHHLPKWIIQDIRWNSSTQFIEFFKGVSDVPFSRIESLPATQEAGRGEAASVVFLDEWAFHPYAEDNYSAITDSLGEEGQIIGISTAHGASGVFYNTFNGAEAKENEFSNWFVGWHKHPVRDDAWYARTISGKKRSLGDDLGEREMAQEHPKNWLEAFTASGSSVFDTKALMAMDTYPPERTEEGVREWRDPVIGGEYVIGVDCSEGLADGDFGAAVVLDWRTGFHVATLHGRWEPRDFARKVVNLAVRWNNGFVGVERNGPGLAVMEAMAQLHYPNVYNEVRVSSGGRPQVTEGWVTTKSTKPVMVAEMQEAIAAGELRTADEVAIGEFLTYVREEPRIQEVKTHGRSQKVGAQRGKYDDIVIAYMIAWQMRKYYERGGDRLPEPYIAGTRGLTQKELDYVDGTRSGSKRVRLVAKAGAILPSTRYV